MAESVERCLRGLAGVVLSVLRLEALHVDGI
jgi:hypothetical protein